MKIYEEASFVIAMLGSLCGSLKFVGAYSDKVSVVSLYSEGRFSYGVVLRMLICSAVAVITGGVRFEREEGTFNE